MQQALIKLPLSLLTLLQTGTYPPDSVTAEGESMTPGGWGGGVYSVRIGAYINDLIDLYYTCRNAAQFIY